MSFRTAFLTYSALTSAMFGITINDLTTHPLGTLPPIPAAGGVFYDPVFNTPILRVTDQNDDGGSTQGFTNFYSSTWDMFNKDSTRFAYVNATNGAWYTASLDVANRRVSNKLRMTIGDSIYWSRLDPDTVYAVQEFNAAKIWKYSFKTASWTLVADLSPLLPTLAMQPNTDWIGSRGMSWDDNRFHIDYGSPSVAAIYDVALGRFVGQITLAQAQAFNPAVTDFTLGKSTMDAGGHCIITAGNEIWANIETGQIFNPGFGNFAPGGAGYGDSHQDYGPNNVMASGNMGNLIGLFPGVVAYDPNNLSTYVSQRRVIGPRALWGVDSHTSYRGADGQWVTITQDGGPPIGVDANTTPIFGLETFQLSINSPADGSINRRIVGNYSDGNPADWGGDTGKAYWAVQKASASQDGRVIGYGSTYGFGPNRHLDVYIAFIASPVVPQPPTDLTSSAH
jgi:hypothetical protein